MAINSFSKFLLLTSITLASAAKSPGCGKPLPKAQQPGQSNEVRFSEIQQTAGKDRTYLIHIPSNYNPDNSVPLIFSFHGKGGDSKSQEELSQFSNEEWNPNGIAVYPQGDEV